MVEQHKSEDSVAEFSPTDNQWQGITLTEAAAKRINELTDEGQWIRMSVKSSGCTGYAYVLGMADEITTNDLVYQSHGASLLVAAEAMPFIDGTEVDFVQQGLNQTFVYNNPNVTAECGCGESFGV